MRASSSGDSNSSKRVPLTVPAVPTGMKTGVSITARRVVSVAERASPSVAMTWKSRLEAGGWRLGISTFGYRLRQAAQHLAYGFQLGQQLGAGFRSKKTQIGAQEN